MTADKIKSECLIAFIHSRLIGLGNNGDVAIAPAFQDDKCGEKAVYVGRYFQNKLEKISTFQKIQNKLSGKQNFAISELYYKSYKLLEKTFDKYVPFGSEVIEGLIGLNLLALYLEFWNEHKLKDDFERLTDAISLYEKNANNDKLSTNMQKIASNIFKDYAKYAKIKYE